MIDKRRTCVSFSEREIYVVMLALGIGRMSLAADEQLSLRQSRDLDRAISKVVDAEKRLARGVQSDGTDERAGDVEGG